MQTETMRLRLCDSVREQVEKEIDAGALDHARAVDALEGLRLAIPALKIQMAVQAAKRQPERMVRKARGA